MGSATLTSTSTHREARNITAGCTSMLQHTEGNNWAVSHVSRAACLGTGVRSMQGRGPTGSPHREICIDEARVFLRFSKKMLQESLA